MDKYKILLAAVFLSALMVGAFFLGKNVGVRGKADTQDRSFDLVPEAAVNDEALLAIVIDDAGYSRENFNKIEELGVPLTLAVLPGLQYSGEVCELARANKLDIILHLPMEPKAETWAREKNTVLSGMDSKEVDAILTEALLSVQGATGVSNHMGSRATGDEKAIKSLMSSLGRRGLFFLDSVTTSSSVCEKVAKLYNVTYLSRDVFLDNETDDVYIAGKIMESADIALAKGEAIAIGHDREMTIKAIKESLPELKKKGIRLVVLGEIMVDATGFGLEEN